MIIDIIIWNTVEEHTRYRVFFGYAGYAEEGKRDMRAGNVAWLSDNPLFPRGGQCVPPALGVQFFIYLFDMRVDCMVAD